MALIPQLLRAPNPTNALIPEFPNVNLANVADGDAGNTMKMATFSTRTINGKVVTVIGNNDILPMPQNIETSYKQNWAWEQAGDYNSMHGIVSELYRAGYKTLEALTPDRMFKSGSYNLGLTINDKVKYMYQGPNARNFQFVLIFQPNNAGENAAIQAWIKRVKLDSAPEYTGNQTFFKFPKFFKFEWTKLERLFKTGTVAVDDITVNYTPEGLWSEHVGGLPTATKVTLSLTELDYVTKDKVEANW